MNKVSLAFLLVVSVVLRAGEPGVTKANFNKIQIGMAYWEVKYLLGKEGELISESGSESYRTVMYKWVPSKRDKGALGANMNAMFQNDKLVNKAQYGLK
jgi:hypothetical protein